MNFTIPGCNVTSDEKNATLSADGKYLVVNNKHGERRLAEGDTYDQTVGATARDNTFPVGWKWILDTEQPSVKGYPQVQWGTNPHTGRAAGDELPIRLDLIRDLVVLYDLAVSGTGKFSVVFDLWITSDPVPTKETITNEIMIWIVDEVGHGERAYPTIGEEQFGMVDYRIARGAWHSYPSWMFLPKTENKFGWAAIGKMLEYLTENGSISAEDYLASLAIGTEMHDGRGIVLLRNYRTALSTVEGGKDANLC